ncbi:kinase-like domain, phloem protein 2-like protein [Tanacetum coccineum]
MSLPSNEFPHLKVPLENILSATNNFARENAIRKSLLSKDYRGELVWSGELIHISARRFNKEMYDREQMFWMEISMLSTLKHTNLVSLVGFCDDNDEKIIIIRRETRGMLSEYLSDTMLLTWVRRLKICVGIAHALSNIHYDEARDFSVIHRLISSSRVLLSDDWEPMLSDFECSMKIRASERNHSFHSITPTYVNGYGDPTYIETKSVNHKSDIYSFGIVLFELLYGRESIIDDDDNKSLGPAAIFHYRKKILEELIDPVLWKQMDLQSFDKFAAIAYECLDEERSRRPNIDDIVPRLEKALELARENRPNSGKSARAGLKSDFMSTQSALTKSTPFDPLFRTCGLEEKKVVMRLRASNMMGDPTPCAELDPTSSWSNNATILTPLSSSRLFSDTIASIDVGKIWFCKVRICKL